MKIILIRHGETHENAQGVLQGHTYGTLTERGKQQIELLAERLANEPVLKILSSDLPRASYTSERLAAKLGVPIELHQDLRERFLGGYEGRPVKEYTSDKDQAGGDTLTFTARGAETMRQLEARAKRVWEGVVRPEGLKGPLIVSAHGLFNRVLLTALLGYPLGRLFELEQENTCVNFIELNPSGGQKVLLMNCTAHLAEEHLTRRGKTTY